jgi:hypothetical protein
VVMVLPCHAAVKSPACLYLARLMTPLTPYILLSSILPCASGRTTHFERIHDSSFIYQIELTRVSRETWGIFNAQSEEDYLYLVGWPVGGDGAWKCSTLSSKRGGY